MPASISQRRLESFLRAKMRRRLAQIEASVARYLHQLDSADRQEPSPARTTKRDRLKDKIATLKQEMRCLGKLEARMLAAPDQLWVADITYVPTWAGFLDLAVVLDVFSRRMVGWAMGHNLRTQLVLDALNMAIGKRKPQGVIHHSDQGSHYTSVAFGLHCKEANVSRSMGSVGDAYDNAMCEGFFATPECDLLDRRKFQTKAEARIAIFEFIEGGYNPGRRHSALDYKSPIDFERSVHEQLESASP